MGRFFPLKYHFPKSGLSYSMVRNRRLGQTSRKRSDPRKVFHFAKWEIGLCQSIWKKSAPSTVYSTYFTFWPSLKKKVFFFIGKWKNEIFFQSALFKDMVSYPFLFMKIYLNKVESYKYGRILQASKCFQSAKVEHKKAWLSVPRLRGSYKHTLTTSTNRMRCILKRSPKFCLSYYLNCNKLLFKLTSY